MLIPILKVFFQISCQPYFFGANLVSKSEALQTDWNFIEGYIIITILMFIFSKILTGLHCISKLNSIKNGEQLDFGMKFSPKI